MHMSRGTNQKFKLSYLSRIMLEKTDDEHSLTMPQIMAELEKYDVTAERKSIYQDFQDMEKLGIEIIKEQIGRETYYHVGAREFELAEVKLLIDSIQSSKFITQTKSRELITKIKKFVSEYQAKQLQRQVFINDRVKNMNESVYYNVDEIADAISRDRQIRFHYFDWNVRKEMQLRKDGRFYQVSPWLLTWDDENYYMVAFDDHDQKIKHYRVDKMMRMSVEDEMREGKEIFKNFDMAAYSKATFGMYSGKRTKVYIQFPNSMCGVFIDRFGKEISFRKVDDDHSTVAVDVAVSHQFFGWIFSLGKEVKVIGPDEVVEQMRIAAEEFAGNYR